MTQEQFSKRLLDAWKYGSWKSNYGQFKDVRTGLTEHHFVVRFNWEKYGTTEVKFSLPKAPAHRKVTIEAYEMWLADFQKNMPPANVKVIL